MNERMRGLAEQCHHRYSEHNIDLEKFTELIVRECANIFGQEGTGRYEVDGNWIAKTIKEHFGIE